MLEQVGTIIALSLSLSLSLLNFISKNLENKIFIFHLLLSNANTIFEPILVFIIKHSLKKQSKSIYILELIYRSLKYSSGRAALDALTTKRCYRNTISFKNAKGIITSDSVTHFSSEVVKAFSSITEHELSNQEVVYVR